MILSRAWVRPLIITLVILNLVDAGITYWALENVPGTTEKNPLARALMELGIFWIVKVGLFTAIGIQLYLRLGNELETTEKIESIMDIVLISVIIIYTTINTTNAVYILAELGY